MGIRKLKKGEKRGREKLKKKRRRRRKVGVQWEREDGVVLNST